MRQEVSPHARPSTAALPLQDYAACSWPADVPGGGVHGSRGVAEWFDAQNEAPGTPRAAAWTELWACLGGGDRGGGDGAGGGGVGNGSGGGNGSGDGSSGGRASTRSGAGAGGYDVISFSHFLPHQVGGRTCRSCVRGLGAERLAKGVRGV
jgi:hypothetical protein